MSAALLRAILMNHVAHSEASKAAKLMEANLRGRIDDMEITTAKLEVELRRQVRLLLFTLSSLLSDHLSRSASPTLRKPKNAKTSGSSSTDSR